MQEAKNLKEDQDRIYPPMVEGDHTFGSVSDKIGEGKTDLPPDAILYRRPFVYFMGKLKPPAVAGG